MTLEPLMYTITSYVHNNYDIVKVSLNGTRLSLLGRAR